MNRFEILLNKKESFLLIIENWIHKNKRYLFSEYKWYRKRYGGKWTKWNTRITSPVWMPSEKKPGCCFGKIKEESWKERYHRI